MLGHGLIVRIVVATRIIIKTALLMPFTLRSVVASAPSLDDANKKRGFIATYPPCRTLLTIHALPDGTGQDSGYIRILLQFNRIARRTDF
jgi:hypothetical protein